MFWPNKKFDFNGLFVLDMANNHQGNLEHGLLIVREFAAVAREAGVRAGIKFQFRELNSFIHPDFRESTENKHIPRFLSTALSWEDFAVLAEEVRNQGLITIATPFDEKSVELAEKLGIEILKVASCSALDWPLLQRIAESGKPVICSTANLSLAEVDKIVSFFDHRGVDYALMHCVAIYPTPKEKLNLERIKIFKDRYPHVPVGFSTHESPDELDAVKVAYAKGAQIFERHVGIETEEIKLNSYSSRPEEISRWFEAFKDGVKMVEKRNPEEDIDEKQSLESLMRGVYFRDNVAVGEKIGRERVFFAMPLLPGQLKSGQWKDNLTADRDYFAGQPAPASVRPNVFSNQDVIYQTIRTVKGMLNAAKIFPNYDATVEFSHHYGLEKFFEFGAVIIDCINREYCKKLIIALPGQNHPYHYHKRKEETFQVLAGQMEVELEGKKRIIYPGDTILVPRGIWHSFSTNEGVIFEEVSTTHFNDDSFYADKSIARLSREDRKTKLINWGRHQFDEIK